jgi:hypothetical protein
MVNKQMRRKPALWIGIGVIGLAMGLRWGTGVVDAAAPTPKASGQPISYNRDIRSILSENCYACHGPDGQQRKAGLRLDQMESATHPLKKTGDTAIVPGDLAHSVLIDRITTTDPDDHMPPPDSGKKLSATQVQLLRRWIAEGAKFEGLWSIQPVSHPEPPAVNDAKWVRNPIDNFVMARLEKEGLSPSPEADRPTLIRRLSLDLIGLPPTPAEIDAFVNDSSPDAYEKVVDRLLANPHYGERMALEWLDAARFGDTHGYHIDAGRDMTAWRDWVIKAFNNNQRFDQFTIEQLAGDLLPHATMDQKIASGFQRNAMVNFEGGAIPEEYLTAYQIDRVNTLGAVWLGLTVGCAECHDHKFDPITQKDFYSLYAFFNSIAEKGLDGEHGNAAPVLTVSTPAEQQEEKKLNDQIAALQKQLDGPDAAIDAEQANWEQAEIAKASDGRVAWQICDISKFTTRSGAIATPLKDQSVLITGPNMATDNYKFNLSGLSTPITAMKLEVLPDDSLPAHGPGRAFNGNFVLTKLQLQALAPHDTTEGDKVAFKSVKADFDENGFPSDGLRRQASAGWAIDPQAGKPHEIIVQFDKPVAQAGARLAVKLEFNSPFAQHSIGRFRASTTSAEDPFGAAKPPARVYGILSIPLEKRTDEQTNFVRKYFRANISEKTKAIIQQQASLQGEIARLKGSEKTTMVMEELPTPRKTFVLIRGQYDKFGPQVFPNTPAALPPLPADAPRNRLGLARWLVSPQQPLTARVEVNRYWQMYFGTGLVKTSEDFGMQGEYPSHPELLDWLASEFVSSGWDVKAMQRLIVTSATYRQSSHASAQTVAGDPGNRLLARGPRFRLEAELIRDEALAVSGLLNDQIGGKSVLPYQPPGLWEELMARNDGDRFTAQKYVQDHGPDLYRRGLYTFRKRTSPVPELITFDAPDREICTVLRSRTNTPLQALVLMNDPTFVEAARKLAERAMIEGGKEDSQRIGFAFRLATGRLPRTEELAVLQNVLDQEREIYLHDTDSANKLLSVGESPINKTLDPAQHAAWTMLCSTILNLDETISKN